MDLLPSSVALPLLFGGLGVFGLFRLLRRMRARAYLKDAIVVITGATSGLGKGGFEDTWHCKGEGVCQWNWVLFLHVLLQEESC